MEQDKLDDVVAMHAEWLRTGGQSGRQADLEEADLRQADLRGVDLSFATLAGANLERAELAGARLNGAVLSKTSLQYACFAEADLHQADLSGAFASGADFASAKLVGAILTDIQLDYACLRFADLSDADLAGASLAFGDLSDAVISESAPLAMMNLWHVNITNTKFGGSRHVLALATRSKPARETSPSELRSAKLVQKASLLWIVIGLTILLSGAAINIYEFIAYGALSKVTSFNYFVPLFIIVSGVPFFIGAHWIKRSILRNTAQSSGPG